MKRRNFILTSVLGSIAALSGVKAAALKRTGRFYTLNEHGKWATDGKEYKVKSLSGGNNNHWDNDDIEYFHKRIFAALKIPEKYLRFPV